LSKKNAFIFYFSCIQKSEESGGKMERCYNVDVGR
jgi:hypothetical protein